MTAWTGPAAEESRRIRNQHEQTLVMRGVVCATSGTLQWADGMLALHTDFGPAGQDKDTNQDYVVAWVPGSTVGKQNIGWALAMADGVTSSLYAEVGAELACWSALACLVSGGGNGQEKARAAIDAAGEAIGLVADAIAAAGELYRPAAEFPSTWRYTLREGLLLQTTLTLAWLENGVLNLAMVGDGGAAVEEIGETGPPNPGTGPTGSQHKPSACARRQQPPGQRTGLLAASECGSRAHPGGLHGRDCTCAGYPGRTAVRVPARCSPAGRRGQHRGVSDQDLVDEPGKRSSTTT